MIYLPIPWFLLGQAIHHFLGINDHFIKAVIYELEVPAGHTLIPKILGIANNISLVIYQAYKMLQAFSSSDELMNAVKDTLL